LISYRKKKIIFLSLGKQEANTKVSTNIKAK